jgi:hypothetical protein
VACLVAAVIAISLRPPKSAGAEAPEQPAGELKKAGEPVGSK